MKKWRLHERKEGNRTFNSNDLNKDFWLSRAYKEAQRIYENKSTRGYNVKTGLPRTFNEVKETLDGNYSLKKIDLRYVKDRYDDLIFVINRNDK